MAQDHITEFHVLRGDANGDRVTNDLDLLAVWQNLAKLPGEQDPGGDLTGDDQLTVADLDEVRANYLALLPTPAAPAPLQMPAVPDVALSESGWSDPFMENLEGPGEDLPGIDLDPASGVIPSLGWTGVDRVVLGRESGEAYSADDLRIEEEDGEVIPVSSFDLGPGSSHAIWTLDEWLANGVYTVSLMAGDSVELEFSFRILRGDVLVDSGGVVGGYANVQTPTSDNTPATSSDGVLEGTNLRGVYDTFLGTLQFSDTLMPESWADVPGGPHNTGAVNQVITGISHRFYRVVLSAP